MNPDEPRPPAGAVMPEDLSPAAKQAWARLAPILENAGLLTVADADALEMYCEAYARWKSANAMIAKFGPIVKGARSNFPVQSPYVTLSNQAWAQMKQILDSFGMNPVSRTRVSKSPGTQGKVSRLRSVLGGRDA